MVFVENQTIAFLTSKTKTFAMAYINSKCFYRSRASSKTIFVRPWYTKFWQFGQKPLFIFSRITR